MRTKSSFITDADGYASQHLQYLPFGEPNRPFAVSSRIPLNYNTFYEQLFVEQRSTANYYTPYKFSGKEIDEETSYSYFGARYYMSDVSIWLSVDPMRDKSPSMSPYMYCNGNPIVMVDPDGCYSQFGAWWRSAITGGSKIYKSGNEWGYNTTKDGGTAGNFGHGSKLGAFFKNVVNLGNKISNFLHLGKERESYKEKSDRGGVMLTTKDLSSSQQGPAIQTTSKEDGVGQYVNIDNMPFGVPGKNTGSLLENIDNAISAFDAGGKLGEVISGGKNVDSNPSITLDVLHPNNFYSQSKTTLNDSAKDAKKIERDGSKITGSNKSE